MTNLSKQAIRLCKIFGTYVLAAIIVVLAVGVTVEPALADRDDRNRRERYWRHEQQQNERHWRESQRRRVYVVPPYDPYYAPPPPVYYYPQPVAPSLNLIIPLRIH